MQAEMATNYGLIMAGTLAANANHASLVFQKILPQRYYYGAIRDNTLRKLNICTVVYQYAEV